MGVGRKCSAVDDRLEEEALESRCATDNYLDGGKNIHSTSRTAPHMVPAEEAVAVSLCLDKRL